MTIQIYKPGSRGVKPTGNFYPSGDNTAFTCKPGGDNFYGASLTPSIVFERCIPGYYKPDGQGGFTSMTVWDIAKQRQLQDLTAIGENVALFSRLVTPNIVRSNYIITAYDATMPNYIKVFWTLSDRQNTHQVPNIDALDFVVTCDGVKMANAISLQNMRYDDEYVATVEFDGGYVLVFNAGFNAAAHNIEISYSTVCECVLINRGQAITPDACPYCNGTTYYYGYVMYVSPLRPDGLIPMSFATNTRTRPIQDAGLNKVFQTTAVAPSFPVIRERDFIVRFWPNGDQRERLQVTGVAYVEGKDAILLEQQLTVERVREGHAITKVRAMDVPHVTIIPGTEDQMGEPGNPLPNPDLSPDVPGSLYYVPMVTGLELALVN